MPDRIARMGSLRAPLRRLRRDASARLYGEATVRQLVADGMRVGKQPHIARPVHIDTLHPWLITIGDYVTIGTNVCIVTHDSSLHHYTAQTRLGRVDIGDRVYVGVGAVLLPGTTIGADSVVGAGAVVHGDVPPGSLVVGNPGQVSPIKAIVAWQQVSARRAPTWPREGWTRGTGITAERKAEQRDALAGGAAGYVPARWDPDNSPYAKKQRDG